MGPRRRADAGNDRLDGCLRPVGPIYAGTNEIQRNIVAERVLGLAVTTKFGFTDEQDSPHTVRDLADRCPRRSVGAGQRRRFSLGLWRRSPRWVFAVLAPEAGGRHERGRPRSDPRRSRLRSVPELLVEHVAVAVPALAEAGHAALEAAIAGDSTITLNLSGEVIVGAVADAVVHRNGHTLHLVTEWQADAATSIDRPAARRTPDITAADPLDGADPDLAFDRAALGMATQCIGVARRLLESTVEYVGERHQFGKPVGSYQAVKHHLANVKIALDFAAACLSGGVVAARQRSGHRGRRSMAKAQASGRRSRCSSVLQCRCYRLHVRYDLAVAETSVDACRRPRRCAVPSRPCRCGHRRLSQGRAVGSGRLLRAIGITTGWRSPWRSGPVARSLRG